MIIVCGALVATAAVVPAGASAAAPSSLADLVRTSIGQDLPEFAGYRATSLDGTAMTIITMPDASDCSELEMTGAVSFMGSGAQGNYVYNIVAAKCEPGIPAEYVGVIQTRGGDKMLPGALGPGDRIKIMITDNGTKTTVTMTNLSEGTRIKMSTSTVPNTYEVGTTNLGAALVGGSVSLTKNQLDGARLKAADPTRVTYDGGGLTFKPTKLEQGQDFRITTG